MKFRISLRNRVSFAFALMGMLVSLGLAGTFYLLTINMEQRLIAETLSAELEDYIARYKINPETPPPSSTTIQTHVILPGKKYSSTVLQNLTTGLHQVQLEGREYYAEVRLADKMHFIVLYDDQQIRHREDQLKFFFGLGVLLMTMLSAMLGFWMADRVISPVGNLVARVADLRPEDDPEPLTNDFPRDDVGALAREFDAYQQRLAAFIEREQAFTSDVSHELRTPLAVIEGASEVLLDDLDLSEAQHVRVERIARSARAMSELVSALLLLAREENGYYSGDGCAVEKLLPQVVEGSRHLLRNKPVKIILDIQVQMFLQVECTLLSVVIANLIRNALYYTEHGQVSICLNEQGVSVMDTGIGMSEKQIQRIFDRYYSESTTGEGIGLSLVKRICQRYGWKIDIESHEGEGTIFQLLLKSTAN
ncbi:MAG: HAMP domain-containing histidine kinase [Gammaproteobacteria bacterium]|nr:HAMP domain-containing histidine kinase [Gammaproteobacteria bacterium]